MCGDLVCDSDESCSSCFSDCGPCDGITITLIKLLYDL